jgi:predicted glycoside hydrolase/deacetylase ChbG (UPF0249 family)
MKYLIVNADDFGATPGITRGILEAYHHGVVTSTSFMVTTPWSEEAAALAADELTLSIGLHVDLTSGARDTLVDLADAHECLAELEHQIQLFGLLIGRPPTHLDSHHNSHRDPRVRACFQKVAREQGLPLRDYSPARYLSSFYGQWSGETHPEQIGVASFLRLLDEDVGDGITELSCHPGYCDPDLRSGYAVERELELQTLCEPAIRRGLEERGIALIGFRDLQRVHPAALAASV